MRLAHLLALACATWTLAGSAMAQERMPAERWTRPFDGVSLPPCDSTEVLSRIQSRFSQTERTFWNSDLQIVSFEAIRPIGFRPWGLDFIPRLFCTGSLRTSDGVRRTVDYSIVEDGGMIGIGPGVEWCIGGLDRHRAFAPNCKMARP